MPCKPVNCAQCLTVRLVKNQPRGVKQFLGHLEKSGTFDPDVVVHITSFPRFMRYAHEDKDIRQVGKFLLLNPNEPHLSSRNSHQHSTIRSRNGSIKCALSASSSSNARMWIPTSSQSSSLRAASILWKWLMKSGVLTSIQGSIVT